MIYYVIYLVDHKYLEPKQFIKKSVIYFYFTLMNDISKSLILFLTLNFMFIVPSFIIFYKHHKSVSNIPVIQIPFAL